MHTIPQQKPCPILDKRWDDWTEAERLGFMQAFFKRSDALTPQ